jgi:hypothetical protein
VKTATVRVCGSPELAIRGGLAQFSVVLHTTDPDSSVHATIFLYLHPDSGRFWFELGWDW